MKVFGVFKTDSSNVPLGLFDSKPAALEAATGIGPEAADGDVRPIQVYSDFDSWLADADDASRTQHLSRLRMLRDRLNVVLGEPEEPAA